jgi:hypothetical protein
MELKVKDLRIGNWVTLIKQNIYENKDYQLDDYDIFKASEFDDITECLLPIPLTEEWLIKFGLKDKYYFVGELCLSSDENGYYLSNDDIGFCLEYIEYVHQLQNLYHSLTGGLELQIIK